MIIGNDLVKKKKVKIRKILIFYMEDRFRQTNDRIRKVSHQSSGKRGIIRKYRRLIFFHQFSHCFQRLLSCFVCFFLSLDLYLSLLTENPPLWITSQKGIPAPLFSSFYTFQKEIPAAFCRQSFQYCNRGGTVS